MKDLLDQYVARLQNLEPFEIQSIDPSGNPQPWYTVTGDIVRDLVIYEHSLAVQVQSTPAQIAHWGRHVAQAKRIWEIEERGFRTWKARQVLAASEPPPENSEEAKVWKKPTEAKIEALYRTHEDYAKWSARVERAEEAFNAATTILEAFKAKAQALKGAVFRDRDANYQLSVP